MMTALAFKPLTDTVGVEVIGVDPEHLSAADRQALYEAWLYHVLVIHETPLTEEVELVVRLGVWRDRSLKRVTLVS